MHASQITRRKSLKKPNEVPSYLEFYIDYDRMGRDMEMSGDIFTIETGTQPVRRPVQRPSIY